MRSCCRAASELCTRKHRKRFFTGCARSKINYVGSPIDWHDWRDRCECGGARCCAALCCPSCGGLDRRASSGWQESLPLQVTASGSHSGTCQYLLQRIQTGSAELLGCTSNASRATAPDLRRRAPRFDRCHISKARWRPPERW